jgi:hypothetical protein
MMLSTAEESISFAGTKEGSLPYLQESFMVPVLGRINPISYLS